LSPPKLNGLLSVDLPNIPPVAGGFISLSPKIGDGFEFSGSLFASKGIGGTIFLFGLALTLFGLALS